MNIKSGMIINNGKLVVELPLITENNLGTNADKPKCFRKGTKNKRNGKIY